MEEAFDKSSKHKSTMTIGGRRGNKSSNKQTTEDVKTIDTACQSVKETEDVKTIDTACQSVKETEDVVETEDSNDEILELLDNRMLTINLKDDILDKIKQRLDFGKRKYKHGIIINDDTTKYASDWDKDSARDWIIMGYEELLDAAVYFSAEIIKRNRNNASRNSITRVEKMLKYTIKGCELILEENNG